MSYAPMMHRWTWGATRCDLERIKYCCGAPRTELWLFCVVVADNHVIPVLCEGVMVQLDSPLRVENGVIELSPETHTPEGLYMGRPWSRTGRRYLLES
jgi:hypothetical protein